MATPNPFPGYVTHSLTLTPTHPPTHPLIHSLTHPPTRPPTHPQVDVVSTCKGVTNTRVYFERIDLHPLSLSLSFAQTVADEKKDGKGGGLGIGGNILEIVKNLSSISRAPLQVNHPPTHPPAHPPNH